LFDELVSNLVRAQDESLSKEERATNYFAAACVVREHGMELIGTEVEPDASLWAGGYEIGLTVQERAEHATNAVTGASSDELRRARAHAPEPDERFHYRYRAAALALEAAKLMPNNSDQTALVLYTAGCWLKGRDPQVADILYKMLVRRCRKTE